MQMIRNIIHRNRFKPDITYTVKDLDMVFSCPYIFVFYK